MLLRIGHKCGGTFPELTTDCPGEIRADLDRRIRNLWRWVAARP